MTDPAINDASQNERLDEILAPYLDSERSRQRLDRQRLLAEHADLVDELQAFFADHDRMKAVAEPLRVADSPKSESAAEEATLITHCDLAVTADDVAGSLRDPDRVAERLGYDGLPPTEACEMPAQRGKNSATRAGSVIRYFGDYELLSEIARGGMGVVYKARQVKLNRVVAMKMILAGQLASPEDVRRFYAEAEAAAKLSHPHIVPIFEVGQHEQQHYFSMAFVDGQSLAHRIAQGVLEPREAARLLKDVAGAIAYAHREGVIHRDLKPGNILLASGGRQPSEFGLAKSSEGLRPPLASMIPMVTDFGLAKRVEGEASGLTVTGQILGTPSYMPPEQARGESAEVSYLSDVYSLGAVLYCMVTGRPPFQASNAVDTLVQVMSREPVSPRQLNASVPLDLETIILKCLEKKTSQRYASAQHLVDELTRFLEGRPILARPISAAERGWRWCRRHPAIAALTAGIAASLVIGTVVSWSFAVKAENQARVARRSEAFALTEKQRADEQAKQALLNAKRADGQAQAAKENAQRADARTNEARRNLYAAHMNLAQSAWEDARVGQTLRMLDLYRPQAGVAGGPDDLRGFEWYYWDRSCHSELFTQKVNYGANMAFSADGKRLASVGGNREIKVWDAATGQEQASLALKRQTGKIYGPLNVAWTSDWKRLAWVSRDSPITVMDAANGQELLTLKGHTDEVWCMAFSADAQRLASAGVDHTIKVWDTVMGAELLTIKGHTGQVTSVAFSPDGKRLVSAGSHWGFPDKPGELKLWDAITGQESLSLKGHKGGVLSVAFSADGQQLASASEDQTVKVWNATTGEETLTFKGHTARIDRVMFNPDGTRLASLSADELKVWDVSAARESLRRTGVFSPDWQRLVSTEGGDWAVKV